MELTNEQLQSLGIVLSNVGVCRKIRKIAKLDRVKLDENTHRSGLNKHLFDYLEYCNVDKLDFIKGYLSRLQPYMLERRADQEPNKSITCVIDNLYRVSIYIKVDNTFNEELIISFHEDNKRGIARTNSLIKNGGNEFVPIFADSILSHVEGTNKYVVKALFQRGLKYLPLELAAMKYKDVFIVNKKSINNLFVDYCNEYIRDLYTSNLDLDFDKIEVFSMLQQISFTSYGNDTFSSLSLLIDSYCTQSDQISRATADFALVTFSRNLNLTFEQQTELTELLDEKFKVTSIKGIDKILRRIKDNLCLEFRTDTLFDFNQQDDSSALAHDLYIELNDI